MNLLAKLVFNGPSSILKRIFFSQARLATLEANPSKCGIVVQLDRDAATLVFLGFAQGSLKYDRSRIAFHQLMPSLRAVDKNLLPVLRAIVSPILRREKESSLQQELIAKIQKGEVLLGFISSSALYPEATVEMACRTHLQRLRESLENSIRIQEAIDSYIAFALVNSSVQKVALETGLKLPPPPALHLHKEEMSAALRALSGPADAPPGLPQIPELASWIKEGSVSSSTTTPGPTASVAPVVAAQQFPTQAVSATGDVIASENGFEPFQDLLSVPDGSGNASGTAPGDQPSSLALHEEHHQERRRSRERPPMPPAAQTRQVGGADV